MVTGLFSWPYAYPALVGIMGEKLPDLKGRFLEGATGAVRETKDAGLPNITGTSGSRGHVDSGQPATMATGAFYFSIAYVYSGYDKHWGYGVTFDASRSNAIYGKSTTVQPASYTVNYLIKAY